MAARRFCEVWAEVFCASFGDVVFGEDVGVQCVEDGVGLCKGYACAVDEVYGLEGGYGVK